MPPNQPNQQFRPNNPAPQPPRVQPPGQPQPLQQPVQPPQQPIASSDPGGPKQRKTALIVGAIFLGIFALIAILLIIVSVLGLNKSEEVVVEEEQGVEANIGSFLANYYDPSIYAPYFYEENDVMFFYPSSWDLNDTDDLLEQTEEVTTVRLYNFNEQEVRTELKKTNRWPGSLVKLKNVKKKKIDAEPKNLELLREVTVQTIQNSRNTSYSKVDDILKDQFVSKYILEDGSIAKQSQYYDLNGNRVVDFIEDFSKKGKKDVRKIVFLKDDLNVIITISAPFTNAGVDKNNFEGLGGLLHSVDFSGIDQEGLNDQIPNSN